jgi:hypothetical protein
VSRLEKVGTQGHGVGEAAGGCWNHTRHLLTYNYGRAEGGSTWELHCYKCLNGMRDLGRVFVVATRKDHIGYSWRVLVGD